MPRLRSPLKRYVALLASLVVLLYVVLKIAGDPAGSMSLSTSSTAADNRHTTDMPNFDHLTTTISTNKGTDQNVQIKGVNPTISIGMTTSSDVSFKLVNGATINDVTKRSTAQLNSAFVHLLHAVVGFVLAGITLLSLYLENNRQIVVALKQDLIALLLAFAVGSLIQMIILFETDNLRGCEIVGAVFSTIGSLVSYEKWAGGEFGFRNFRLFESLILNIILGILTSILCTINTGYTWKDATKGYDDEISTFINIVLCGVCLLNTLSTVLTVITALEVEYRTESMKRTRTWIVSGCILVSVAFYLGPFIGGSVLLLKNLGCHPNPLSLKQLVFFMPSQFIEATTCSSDTLLKKYSAFGSRLLVHWCKFTPYAIILVVLFSLTVWHTFEEQELPNPTVRYRAGGVMNHIKGLGVGRNHIPNEMRNLHAQIDNAENAAADLNVGWACNLLG